MTSGRDEHLARVDGTERLLIAAARSLPGCVISGDGRVGTVHAATLLGVKAATLEAWRAAQEGPDCYRTGRVYTYRLRDLATWIELGRSHHVSPCSAP